MSAQINTFVTKPRNPKGMTLAELLIAMAMAIIVIGGIYVLLVQTNRASVGQSYAAEMQQNARIAMELMTREILMAGYDPTNPKYLKNSNIARPMPKVAMTSDKACPRMRIKTRRYMSTPVSMLTRMDKTAATPKGHLKKLISIQVL